MDQAGFRAAARSSSGSDAPVQPDSCPFDVDSGEQNDLLVDELQDDDELPEDEFNAVEHDELQELEQNKDVRRAADNLARRLADRRLRDDLARDDFSGAAYTRFAEELAAYGLAVCRAWLLTGEMFRQCHRRNIRLGERPDSWELHEVDGLAGETVTQALRSFRNKGLRGGGWHEEGGASIKTYFVGACVFAFRNAYRDRIRERRRWAEQHTYDPTDIDGFDAPSDIDVADLVLLRERVAAAFADRPPRQQRLLVMEMLGYSRPEMAELTGSTTAAVQQVLYRMKLAGEKNTSDGNGSTS